jgi:hypothetical protein
LHNLSAELASLDARPTAAVNQQQPQPSSSSRQQQQQQQQQQRAAATQATTVADSPHQPNSHSTLNNTSELASPSVGCVVRAGRMAVHTHAPVAPRSPPTPTPDHEEVALNTGAKPTGQGAVREAGVGRARARGRGAQCEEEAGEGKGRHKQLLDVVEEAPPACVRLLLACARVSLPLLLLLVGAAAV